jgi:hypothetical protein
LSRKVKEVIRAAGLRDELSFTSFRHGGFTKGGDAELTDREMLAQGPHTTVEGVAKVHQAHETADRQRRQEAPGSSNKRRTFVRMSISLLVRIESRRRAKCLKSLERVKGIEPSYSAWKS